MGIIGQEKLINRLREYDLDTFPHSVIIKGEKGSGKHLISSFISSDILKIPLKDITENLSSEVIDQIYRSPNPAIYLINVDELTEKEQNSILKFIEEPLKSIFIILLCENLNILLNTVKNRCQIIEMEIYNKSQLKEFLWEGAQNEDLILKVVRTPGKLKEMNYDTFLSLFDLCNKIASKIELATYANTLSIADKINYKDNYDKFDINIFLDTLMLILKDKYVQESNDKYLEMYLITSDYKKRLIDKRLNKEVFMKNYLTVLWKACRNRVSL